MKNKKIVISLIFMIIINSLTFSVIGIELNTTNFSEDNNNGTVYGHIETTGRCIIIGVPNIKIACGKNILNYQITYTNEYGFFEFNELEYDDTGTTYFIWVPSGQKLLFKGASILHLNEENQKIQVNYFISYFFIFSYIHKV